jgi:DNA-binding CsgD family transcriptional regulator
MVFTLKTWGGRKFRFNRLNRNDSWIRRRTKDVGLSIGFKHISEDAFFGAVDAAWQLIGKRWSAKTGYGLNDFIQRCAVDAVRWSDNERGCSMSQLFKVFVNAATDERSRELRKHDAEEADLVGFFDPDRNSDTDQIDAADFVVAAIKASEISERERDMLMRRLSGESLESIAKSYKLTRERVRQLFERSISRVAEAGRGMEKVAS